MKIAFVYDVIYPCVKGGVEKRVWELAVRLAKRGHEVHLFGMKFWEGEAVIKKDDVIIHGVCRSQNLYTHGRRNITGPLRFSLALLPPLLQRHFDLIDCQQFPFLPAIATRITAAMKKNQLVITWHEVWGDYWYEYLGYKGVFGKIAERIVSCLTLDTVAVSRMTSGRLRKICPSQNPVLIPNGIDLHEIAATRPSEKRSDLIFAGRLIQEKHIDLLIEATRLLIPQFPQLKVLIIGNGPEQERIETLVRVRDLGDHIALKSFCEDHTDLIGFFKSSKVFVLPSTREGFGITALEALACGLPVVTIDHPANAVRDLIMEKNGFLSTLSAEDLAGKIFEALAHHGDMREACIATAISYNWDRISAESEKYYLSVIAKTGPK